MSEKINYKGWLKWREEYYKKNSHISNKEELAKGQQQMETWEKYLKEEDSGHRPC